MLVFVVKLLSPSLSLVIIHIFFWLPICSSIYTLVPFFICSLSISCLRVVHSQVSALMWHSAYASIGLHSLISADLVNFPFVNRTFPFLVRLLIRLLFVIVIRLPARLFVHSFSALICWSLCVSNCSTTSFPPGIRASTSAIFVQ